MSELLQPTSDTHLAEFDQLREDCVLLDLGLFGLIRMSGEDRKGWLQGQATNDLRQFTPGTYAAFCLCGSTGHLQGVFDAWALNEEFLVTTETATVSAFLNRAEQMIILEDVVVEDVCGNYQRLSVQGPQASAQLSRWMTLPTLDAGTAEVDGVTVYLTRSNRTGLGGWDVWVPVTATGIQKKLRSEFTAISLETYDLARLEAGVPRWGIDMTAKTLPPELGSAFEAKHVSYTKGCYMGQEVLMRMHSRGHTNRTWMGLQSEQAIPAGARIVHRLRSDAGSVTSSAWSPDYGFIAAGMVRNEVALEGEIVTVVTDDGQSITAELRSMPILRFF